jgi:hypothetical protein
MKPHSTHTNEECHLDLLTIMQRQGSVAHARKQLPVMHAGVLLKVPQMHVRVDKGAVC